MELQVFHTYSFINILALHSLVSREHAYPYIISQVIKSGASVTSNVDGRTPLWVFCATRDRKNDLNHEILDILVKAGSNVNQAVRMPKIEH
jgi:hypothetical protein